MELNDERCPLHEDATLQAAAAALPRGQLLRRHPARQPERRRGRPRRPPIPLDQTSSSVQLDQVLTTLQSRRPRGPADVPRRVRRRARHLRRRRGPRELYRTSPPAFSYTAQVNEAVPRHRAGRPRRPGPQPRPRRPRRSTATRRSSRTWSPTSAIVTGSFAAEDEALEQAIERAPDTLAARRSPALAKLNARCPPLRAFAREALPGVRRQPGDAATPRTRSSRSSARWSPKTSCAAWSSDLRPTIPQLAALARRTRPFLEQARALVVLLQRGRSSRGRNDTVEPSTGRRVPARAVGRVYKKTAYGSPASPARAARATPTASTSASRPAAARTPSRSRRDRRASTAVGLQDAVGLTPVPAPRRDAATSRTR